MLGLSTPLYHKKRFDFCLDYTNVNMANISYLVLIIHIIYLNYLGGAISNRGKTSAPIVLT